MWKLLPLLTFALVMLTIAACEPEVNDENETTENAMQNDTTIVPSDAELQTIGTGFQFTEGPYWRDDGYLVFSDIPANTIYQWTADEDTSSYIRPSGNSNGITGDDDGNLIVAQHAGRVSSFDSDTTETMIVDSFEGSRLNSPNDLVVFSDGSIYFTDPPYGVDDADRELDFSGVYRIHPNGELELLLDEFDFPNGLTFSPDETVFYVNDSDETVIWSYDVDDEGNLSNGQLFAEPTDGSVDGTTDGMKVDTDGNLYTTGPGGIWIYSPNGELIDRIDTPVPPTNLAFGEGGNSTLFITARDEVYRIELNTEGIQ